MNNLIEIIKEALQLPEAEVKNIQRMGGMTNLNYLVTVNSVNYIVRIPGNGTAKFINRKEEKENLEFSSSLGINPEQLYFNVETGVKITKKVANATTFTKELSKNGATMAKVINIFHTLHGSKVGMTNRFELFKIMDKYEQLALDAKASFFDGFIEVKKEVMALKEYYQTMAVEECPCHIDPACGNFIEDGAGKVYLIDWEYSGMFDPLWDISGHCMESGFSEAEETLFLSKYFQRDVTDDESERILMHKIFQDYLWSLWTLFKETKGDDFGTYGVNRYERMKENIAKYKEIFAEQ